MIQDLAKAHRPRLLASSMMDAIEESLRSDDELTSEIKGDISREIPQFTKCVPVYNQTLPKGIRVGVYSPTLLSTCQRSQQTKEKRLVSSSDQQTGEV